MDLTWARVRERVRALELDTDDVICAGSLPLLAHGVVDRVGDIDLVVRGRSWKRLAAAHAVRQGELGDRVIDLAGDLQVFSGWHGENADALAERAATIDDMRVASIADVVAYKRRLNRPKDAEHLGALERWANEMTSTVATHRSEAAPFADRAEAGARLAPVVAALAPEAPLVLALPRGGAPVAAPVAAGLGCPLDVLVVRKLGLPTNPEYAFGAIGEGGDPLIDPRIVAAADLLEAEVAEVVERERSELARRVAHYRAGRPALDLAGRTAIIVDDGAATGSTALAAIAIARTLGAARVWVALGACPPDIRSMLGRHSDLAVAAATPEPFISVGQWYRDFAPTTDGEVMAALSVSA